MKKVLLIDNYDSFTYNLLHSLEKVSDIEVCVVRNDLLHQVQEFDFCKVVLSPGPGLPSEAGQLMSFIETYYQKVPILGICLGHQALGSFFGAQLIPVPKVLHGVQLSTQITNSEAIFTHVPPTILTGHYHSWVLSKQNFPTCLRILAQNKQGGIMAFKHKKYAIYGIQFHPESVMTPYGDLILQNWLTSS